MTIKEVFSSFFKRWDKAHELTVRLIRAMPEKKLGFKCTNNNYSFGYLAEHIYHGEKVLDEAAMKGELRIEDFGILAPPDFTTTDELVAYAEEIHALTNKYFSGMSEEELMKPIRTPWGESPLFLFIFNSYEHMMHHRGQMYIYLRLVGAEPPPMDINKDEMEKAGKI